MSISDRFQGFNFVGFDPDDEQYSNKVDTFYKVFDSLGLDDFFTYDFSIDVYYLDVVSVAKSSGKYFKELSVLSSFIEESNQSNSKHSKLNRAQVISEIPRDSNGFTFQKFMNNVKNLNKALEQIKSESNRRTDYFTLVKYRG